MPFYKAIAQNTFRLTSDVTLTTVGDITKPGTANIGKVKVIAGWGTMKESVQYIPLSSVGSIVSSYSSIVWASGSNLEFSSPHPRACKVGDEVFHGICNARFGATLSGRYRVPPYQLSCVMHINHSAEGIEYREYVYDGFTTDSSDRATGRYFDIPKTVDDIILALTFEYPKYDITMGEVVPGLQYSLDDGFTFQDVTSGLLLEQIEHVVFKNTDYHDLVIGSEIVPAGFTKVVIPESDGVWDIVTYEESGHGGSN